MMLGGVISTNAGAATIEYSYLDESTNYWGTQKKENYDIAIFLPGEDFAGFRVKAIQAKVNVEKGTANYLTSTTTWMSKELNLVDSKNAPDVASYDAVISDEGVIYTELPEAYTITSDGLYVGYSIGIKLLDSGTKFPVAVAATDEKNAFFCHSNRIYLNWTNIAETSGYACAITVTLEADNLPDRNVTFYSTPENLLLELGKEKIIPVEFKSSASEGVSSVDFNIAFNGSTYTSHYDLDQPLAAGIGRRFFANVAIPAQDELVEGDLEINIAKVNGEANEAKASVAIPTRVLSVVPVHQTLFEEYTGTWCGWCVRGFAALEYIAKNHPDFVVAAFHNGDAMTITSSYPNSPSGFPAGFLNRSLSVDPYYGTQTYSTLKLPVVGDIQALNAEETPWAVNVSHEWDSENILTAKAEVANIWGFENETYKIAYLLVADGLSGEGNGWDQSNYYSSQAQSTNNIPELNAFCRGGVFGSGTVAGLVFNDVVVSTSGIRGVNNSIPKSLEADEKVEHSLSFDLSNISSSFIPDRKKLRVIAAVLDSRGRVMNCAKHEINDVYDPSAVSSVENTLAPVEYYNLNGVKVDNPHGGVFIRRQGNSTSKVVLK